MNKKQSLIKFMAMSKIIGIIIFAFVIIVSVFVMYEMHISQNYDALPQLIISIFGFASVYTGFYLTMAKVEHIEEEKTKREKELLLLKNSNKYTEEEIELKTQQIEKLDESLNSLMNESNNNLLD